MPILQITALARRIASSNPENAQEQAAILQRLCSIRDSAEGTPCEDLADYLDAAALLTSYLVQMGSVGGDEILPIVERLVGIVERTFAERSAQMPAADPVVEQVDHPNPALLGAKDTSRVVNDMLLGEILLRRGNVTAADIERALVEQRATGVRFGEALVKVGATGWREVESALKFQDGCRQKLERHTTVSLDELDRPEDEERPVAAPAADSAPAPKPKLPAPFPNLEMPDSDGGGLRLISDMLLGEVMIQNGFISKDQLEQGLRIQRAAGVRIGEALVQSGAATWEQVEFAIRLQGQLRQYS